MPQLSSVSQQQLCVGAWWRQALARVTQQTIVHSFAEATHRTQSQVEEVQVGHHVGRVRRETVEEPRQFAAYPTQVRHRFLIKAFFCFSQPRVFLSWPSCLFQIALWELLHRLVVLRFEVICQLLFFPLFQFLLVFFRIIVVSICDESSPHLCKSASFVPLAKWYENASFVSFRIISVIFYWYRRVCSIKFRSSNNRTVCLLVFVA